MSNVISVGNHKGGVGKTTSTLNIGAGLSNLGKNILLIDLDPQANLSLSLGIEKSTKSIYNALKGEAYEIVSISKNLQLLPSNLDLSAAEIELSFKTSREYVLSDIISTFNSGYDYILIDCPPSLGLLTLNALTASNCVLIPMQAHYLAMQGLSKFMEIITQIQKRLNKNLCIGGVFVTLYNSRKVLNRNIVEGIENFFGDKVFKTKIRENIALAEAPISKKSIFQYNIQCNGAEDYTALCKEILAMELV